MTAVAFVQPPATARWSERKPVWAATSFMITEIGVLLKPFDAWSTQALAGSVRSNPGSTVEAGAGHVGSLVHFTASKVKSR